MKFTRRSSLVISAAVIALAMAIPAQAASASTTSTPAENTFNQFVSTLDVSNDIQQQLRTTFAALPEAQQDAYIADPASLFTFKEGTTSVTADASNTTAARSSAAAAATRAYQVNNTQSAQIAGVTVATFNLDYRYEVSGSNVTRNLDCAGSASGLGLSANSSPSNYITGGRGTCNVRTNVNVFFQGSPIQFTKLHTVTTVAGNPTRVTGSITNV